jgi:hypothetical protein
MGMTIIPLPPGETFGYLALEGSQEVNNSGEVVGLGDAGAWTWSQKGGVQLLNDLVPQRPSA